MNNTDALVLLLKEEKVTKIERNIYFFSTLLFFITVFINLVNIVYYPILINGLFLELNILMIIFCGYLFFQKQKRISFLADKKLELKIECILNKS